jgi:hypothetical protein
VTRIAGGIAGNVVPENCNGARPATAGETLDAAMEDLTRCSRATRPRLEAEIAAIRLKAGPTELG